MRKSTGYIHLLSKKMRRSIIRSPLQFLTMVLILGLASTLFSGLYASHLAFQDQVNRIYTASNVADVWSTLTYDYTTDPREEVSQDYNRIKETVGDNGTVETQYYSSAYIRGIDAYASVSDTYPTINKPSEIFGEAKDDNYFLFSHQYLKLPVSYGERSEWIDDDGNYKPIEIQLNIGSLKKRIEKDGERLKKVFDEFSSVEGADLLDHDYLSMTVTPTGSMQHSENIAASSTQPFTFLTTRKFLKTPLSEALNKNFKIDALEQAINEGTRPDLEDLRECYQILTHSEDEIIGRYWCNNRCLTRLNNRNDAIEYRDKIETAFKKKTGGSNLLINIDLANTTIQRQLSTDIMQSLQLCYVFPPVFFLVAVLIVLTTISQIILKERKEIGTLKAIGASNRSIFGYYITLTGIISLIGVALGLVVGPLLLPTILDIKYAMLYNLPAVQFVFPTTVAIIMTIVVLLITTLVAFLVARKEIKALPVVSMRPKATNIKRKNLSESKEDNTHKLCFKMAIRNIFCSIPRSIMVIIGVLGCTGLLCCGFGIDDSVKRGIDNDTHMFFNTDSLIYFSNPTAETLDIIKNLKTKDNQPMITAFEPYGCLPVNASRVGVINESFTANVYSIPYALEKEYKFFDIGYVARDNKIAISNKIAKNLGVGVGDYLNFNFLGVTYTGLISKVVDVFFLHGIYIDGLYPNFPTIYQYPTCAYARFNPNVDQKEIMEAISGVQGVSNVVDREGLTDYVNDISSSISYITITIKIFAILLAVVALYNLALLNFKENIRNIATMKVLGFTRREVAESLFFEIITLSLVGIAIGLIIGYPLTVLTLGINKVPMCEFFYYLGPASVFASLFIALGVSAIINAFIGLRNKKVKMVESLKSVE